MSLQEPAEFFRRKPGITYNTTHGKRINRIVPGNGQNSGTVGHYDVPALSHDREACLLECSDCQKVVDTGNLSHGGKELDGDFEFSHIAVAQ